MQLYELLEEVNDRKSFVLFVKALINDRREDDKISKANPEKYQWSSGPLGWENGSIDTYLDAALSCFEDGKWREENPDEITWKKLAEFLYGGKIYE